MKSCRIYYKFNTSFFQYAKNIVDGHNGFEIIKKYELSKLSENKKILEEYGRQKIQALSSVLQSIEDEERSYDGSYVLFRDRKRDNDNVTLNQGALQGESVRGSNNSNSTGYSQSYGIRKNIILQNYQRRFI